MEMVNHNTFLTVRIAEKELGIQFKRNFRGTSSEVKEGVAAAEVLPINIPPDDVQSRSTKQNQDDILRGATLLASRVISVIMNSLFDVVLKDVTAALGGLTDESIDIDKVTGTWDILLNALVKDCVLTSVQNITHGVIKLDRQHPDPTNPSAFAYFKVEEVGELIYYCRNVDLIKEHVNKTFIRKTRNANLDTIAMIKAFNCYSRYYLCNQMQRIAESASAANKAIVCIEKTQEDSAIQGWKAVVASDQHGNSNAVKAQSVNAAGKKRAKNEEMSPSFTKTTTTSFSSQEQQKAAIANDEKKSIELVGSDTHRPNSFLVDDYSLIEDSGLWSSSGTELTTGWDIELNQHLYRHMSNVFNSCKDHSAESKGNEVCLMVARFGNPHDFFAQLFEAVSYNNGRIAAFEICVKTMRTYLTTKVLFWIYMPFSSESCDIIISPSNPQGWLYCSYMLQRRAIKYFEDYTTYQHLDEEEAQAKSLEAITKIRVSTTIPTFSTMKEGITEEIATLTSFMESNKSAKFDKEVTCKTNLHKILCTVMEMESSVGACFDDRDGTCSNFAYDLLPYIFQETSRMLIFKIESSLGPFTSIHSRMLLSGSNQCAGVSSFYEDIHSFNDAKKSFYTSFNNAIAYSDELGCAIPQLPTPLEMSRSVVG